MKIINTSPYDTRALHSIICSVRRYLTKLSKRLNDPDRIRQKDWDLTVYIGARRPPDFQVGFDRGFINVPKLKGTEWHEQLRGITDGAALTSERFALLVLAMLTKSIQDYDPAMLKKGTPVHVPLKVVKPRAPRNILLERYHRALKTEQSWVRKYKYAATKLRKARARVYMYEKKYHFKEA